MTSHVPFVVLSALTHAVKVPHISNPELANRHETSMDNLLEREDRVRSPHPAEQKTQACQCHATNLILKVIYSTDQKANRGLAERFPRCATHTNKN